MHAFTKVTDKICEYISYISMVVIAFIMFFNVICVVARYVGYNITGGGEVTQVMLSALIFSSWAYVQTQHGHIHVTMFLSMMPTKLRFFLFTVTSLLTTVTLLFATVSVFQEMVALITTKHTSTANLLIPYWPFYLIEGVSFAMFSVVLLRDAIKAGIAMFNEEMAKEVQAFWV